MHVWSYVTFNEKGTYKKKRGRFLFIIYMICPENIQFNINAKIAYLWQWCFHTQHFLYFSKQSSKSFFEIIISCFIAFSFNFVQSILAGILSVNQFWFVEVLTGQSCIVTTKNFSMRYEEIIHLDIMIATSPKAHSVVSHSWLSNLMEFAGCIPQKVTSR